MAMDAPTATDTRAAGCCLGVVATGASLAVLSRLGDDQAGEAVMVIAHM